MKKLLLLLLAFCIACFLGCRAPEDIRQEVQSNTQTTQEIVVKQELEREIRTLAVTGVGQVSRMPDFASVKLRVEASGADGGEALAQCAEKTAQVVSALTALGIASSDITAKEPALQYAAETERAGDGAASGAYGTVTVRIRAIQKAPAIALSALEAGAGALLQVEFLLADPSAVYQEALALAVNDASAKAAVMAEELGVSLDGPETAYENLFTREEAMETAQEEGEALPQETGGAEVYARLLEPEEITVSAQIEVNYLLKYTPATTITQ